MEEIMTPSEVASSEDSSQDGLLRRKGVIPGNRIGRSWRFSCMMAGVGVDQIDEPFRVERWRYENRCKRQ
jgi:hypothetical protein